MKHSGILFVDRPVKQQGAALILGLLMLLVMTLLALTASDSAIMQEKIAGNFRDSSLAFHASEAAGRWGAAWLQSLGASSGLPRPFPCTSTCTASATTPVWAAGQYDAVFDWAADGWRYGQSPADAKLIAGYDAPTVKAGLLVSAPPKFILEEQFFSRDDLAANPDRGVVYYRVVASGTGQRASTVRIVSNLLAKRFQ